MRSKIKKAIARLKGGAMPFPKGTRYPLVGLPPDLYHAIREKRIRALFLFANTVAAAVSITLMLIDLFGLNIPTVLVAIYVVRVAIDLSEHIFLVYITEEELVIIRHKLVQQNQNDKHPK